jgi:hypothetical protein
MPLPPPPLPANLEPFRVWFESAPRWIVAFTAGLLLLFGGRLYRLAIIAPGLLGGVALALLLPQDLGPIVIALAAVLLAAVGAVLCHFLERVAVHVVGAAALAGLAEVAWPPLLGGPAPWWGLLCAGALGVLFFPKVFRALIKVVTAVLGALAMAWAIGCWDRPLAVAGLSVEPWMVVAALAAAGLAFQLVAGRKKGKEKEG